MTISFNRAEMMFFLKKRGYTIEVIDSYRAYNSYHNDVEYEKIRLAIAFKKRPSEKTLGAESFIIDCQFGIEKVFRSEMKKALLSL